MNRSPGSASGRRALAYFWDAWGFVGDDDEDFEDFLRFYSTPITPDFAADLGAQIRRTQTSDAQVHAAMLNLAASAPKDKLPTARSFMNSITDPYLHPDFITYVKRKTAQVVDAVEQGVIDTGKTVAVAATGGLALYGLYVIGGILLVAELQKRGWKRA